MPFKDAAARAAYMRTYLAEYRAGGRRTEGKGVSERTRLARARAEVRRKALWEVKNKEWRAGRRRERRRVARAEAERGLLRDVVLPEPKRRTRSANFDKADKRSTPTRRKAA